jgi:hypothetical protein
VDYRRFHNRAALKEEREMKRIFISGVTLAVVLLVVSPGVSPAGDRMNRSASPEFGTWDYWMAEETGNLPISELGTHPGKESMNSASAGVGNWEYWEAEETGNLPGSVPSSHSSRIDNPRGNTAPGSGHDAGEPDWRTINLEP